MFRATTIITHPDFPDLTRYGLGEYVSAMERGTNRIDWETVVVYWATVLSGLDAQTDSVHGPTLSISHTVPDEHADALRNAFAVPLVVDADQRLRALGFTVGRSFHTL